MGLAFQPCIAAKAWRAEAAEAKRRGLQAKGGTCHL